MSRPLVEDIENYVYRMKRIKDSILSLTGEDFLDNHKKTLLFSLLDTMSVGVFGNKYRRNGKRFEAFVIEFCGWENAERLSLQQMAFLLEKTGETTFVELRKFTFKELSKYPKSQPVPFSYDPFMEEVQSFLPTDRIFNKLSLCDLKHVNLLWRYRNSLVHEARSIGADQLFDIEKEPHYIQYYQVGRNENGVSLMEGHWEIYYPLRFFVFLVETAISNLASYLTYHDINPIKNYEFEPLWIRV